MRSYRTLSPLPVPRGAIGGLLSVALSVASRRPGVTRHPALRSSDFPPSGEPLGTPGGDPSARPPGTIDDGADQGLLTSPRAVGSVADLPSRTGPGARPSFVIQRENKCLVYCMTTLLGLENTHIDMCRLPYDIWVDFLSESGPPPAWDLRMGSIRIRFISNRLAVFWPMALAVLGFTPPLPATQASLPQGPGEPEPGPQEAVVVYLVRHAEKSDDGTNDPPLAIAGQIRVQTLKALLADVDLTHIHTTDWKRTRDTARPFAERTALEMAIYDPRELETLAAEIRAAPGRHLVAGHSNTTPQLVAALGGDPLGPIDELEYDRLYVLVIRPGGTTVTTVLRFGEPYVEGRDFGLRSEPPRRTPNKLAGRKALSQARLSGGSRSTRPSRNRPLPGSSAARRREPAWWSRCRP